MHADERALGVLRPDQEPRATQYVGEMLDIIGRLEQNGLAYQAGDGDVNYSVRGFRATASCRARRWTTCGPASAWPWTRPSATPGFRALEGRQGRGAAGNQMGIPLWLRPPGLASSARP